MIKRVVGQQPLFRFHCLPLLRNAASWIFHAAAKPACGKISKEILVILAVLISPALANAWTFPVSVTNTTAGINGGNKLSVTVGTAAPVNVTAGTKYFYPANTITTVSVAIANIASVTSITVDGSARPITSPVVVTKGTASLHSLNVVYSASATAPKNNVMLQQGAGGLTLLKIGSTASTTGYTDVPLGTAVEVVAQPNSGYKLASIKINGMEKAATVSDGLGSTTPVSKTFLIDGAYTPNSVSAQYSVIPQLAATLALPASAVRGAQVTATVTATSNVAPLNFDFSTTCSSARQSSSINTFTFAPEALGTCSVSATTTGPGGVAPVIQTAIVNVTTITAAANWECTSCHAGSSPLLVSLYNSSPHVDVTSCKGCHTGDVHSIIPSAMICQNCHAEYLPNHAIAIGTSTCTSCHDPHSTQPTRMGPLPPPHTPSATDGSEPASYVTSRSSCGDCHRASATNQPIRHQWSLSGHADTHDAPWMAQDFKTLPQCVRCHTTTGFIAYSTGKVSAAWGTSSDTTKEVLTCRGCHKPDFSVRVLAPYSSASAYSMSVDAGVSVSVPYKNSNYLTSNVCIPCHRGTTTGSLLKEAAAYAGFTSVGRALNHFRAGAGILDNNIGYEYDGTPRGTYKDYNKQNTWHSGIGLPDSRIDIGTTSGPCIGCHMSAVDNQHSYKAISKDSTGTITDVAAKSKCDKCHPSIGGGYQMTAESLTERKNAFLSTLAAFRAQLVKSGFNPDTSTTKEWGEPPVRAKNMGAYYNYLLLQRSDTAAYVHNPTYVKRLTLYSIDWLDDNSFNDSVFETINGLEISALDKEGAIGYLELGTGRQGVNCYLCHSDYYN